ncbi:MAG TPA: acetyltransferase [Chryseosolibacter sp.]
MKDLAIFGAGGFGREVALLIDQINQEKREWNFIGFFDDEADAKGGLPIIGTSRALKDIKTPLHLAVAVAAPLVRRSIVGKLRGGELAFPVLCHPRANTGARTNTLGKGTIITEACILTTGISIGEFVIVNLATTIGHDARIGDFCSIMPGTNISGNVRIGHDSLVGTGAKILQNLTLGERCRVGAGAVVIRDVKDGQTVVGVPAKPI